MNDMIKSIFLLRSFTNALTNKSTITVPKVPIIKKKGVKNKRYKGNKSTKCGLVFLIEKLGIDSFIPGIKQKSKAKRTIAIIAADSFLFKCMFIFLLLNSVVVFVLL